MAWKDIEKTYSKQKIQKLIKKAKAAGFNSLEEVYNYQVSHNLKQKDGDVGTETQTSLGWKPYNKASEKSSNNKSNNQSTKKSSSQSTKKIKTPKLIKKPDIRKSNVERPDNTRVVKQFSINNDGVSYVATLDTGADQKKLVENNRKSRQQGEQIKQKR